MAENFKHSRNLSRLVYHVVPHRRKSQRFYFGHIKITEIVHIINHQLVRRLQVGSEQSADVSAYLGRVRTLTEQHTWDHLSPSF